MQPLLHRAAPLGAPLPVLRTPLQLTNVENKTSCTSHVSKHLNLAWLTCSRVQHEGATDNQTFIAIPSEHTASGITGRVGGGCAHLKGRWAGSGLNQEHLLIAKHVLQQQTHPAARQQQWDYTTSRLSMAQRTA